MPGVVFRGTSTTTAVQATAFTALAAQATTKAGLKVIIVPAAAADLTYYAFTSGVLTTTGVPCPNNKFFVISPAEFPLNNDGQPDLTALYFISSAASQLVGGVLL